MLTIALDEQGDFENIKGELNTRPVFIGGILYDDTGDMLDFDNEKKRLQKYLKKVCLDSGCRYPQDLHFSENEGSNNGESVRLTKMKFTETIEEFFEKGTWSGQNLIPCSRKGKYYIFATLRGEYGKKNLFGQNVSEAVRENFASNLYVHMAEDVIERLIFHNPVINGVGKVHLDLATRRVILKGDERLSRTGEYERLGFKSVQRDPGNYQNKISEYLLTNPDNYRTAIEREMIDCGKQEIMIDQIGVKSIYYEHERQGMDFLYLADAVCSYLGFKPEGNNQAQWIDCFNKRAREINRSTKNLIFGYDEVDDYFKKAWLYLEDEDYYRALSTSYDGSKSTGSMAPYYEKNWFPQIKVRLREAGNVSAFSMAIKKYRESVLNNNLNQDKLIYIYNALEEMSGHIKFSNRKDEAELYDLYDAGVSAFSHIGNSQRAKKCFEKCNEYAEYIETERFLRTRSRMVVFLCDTLDFEEALTIADENVTYQEILTEMKREIFGKAFSEALSHAISLSGRGQVYAFLRDKRAEKDFLDALAIMDEGTPDYFITQSYLLHFYIDQKEKEKYEPLAKDYFGGKTTLVEQFNYLVKEGAKENKARFSLKFALYVYIKGLYVFYLAEIPINLLDKLKNIEKSLTEISTDAKKQINGHPWEIIYKYLALIMLINNEKVLADDYINKVIYFHENMEGIIKIISDEGIQEYKGLLKKSENAAKNRVSYMYV